MKPTTMLALSIILAVAAQHAERAKPDEYSGYVYRVCEFEPAPFADNPEHRLEEHTPPATTWPSPLL